MVAAIRVATTVLLRASFINSL